MLRVYWHWDNCINTVLTPSNWVWRLFRERVWYSRNVFLTKLTGGDKRFKREILFQLFKHIHTVIYFTCLRRFSPQTLWLELHCSTQYDIVSIGHLSPEVRQRGCCLLPSVSVLHQLLRSSDSLRENKARYQEKALRDWAFWIDG